MLYIRIREVARAKAIGQRRIAKSADIDLSIVQRLYRNPYAAITSTTLEKLCRALRCTPDELLQFEPPIEP